MLSQRCLIASLVLLALGQSSALQIGSSASSAVARCSAVRMQMAPAQQKTKQKVSYKTGDGGGGGGKGGNAAQIAKPKRKAHIEEVPMWNVFLLGDEEYEEDPVCEVLLNVSPSPRDRELV